MNQPANDEDSFTLDPPGTIAVVGAGVLGLEAALYGRFLGYEVQVLEATRVGSTLIQYASTDLPMMPNRMLSTLALSALQAQRGDDLNPPTASDLGQWVEQVLVPLSETDLLQGRILTGMRVTEICQVPVEAQEALAAGDEEVDENDGDDDVPPDFLLHCQTLDGASRKIDIECVILAVGGAAGEIQLGFPLPAPYFFSIGGDFSGDWEQDLRTGCRQITEIFAQLAGRPDLDLYRPRRL
jgi:hypothetical protein